MFDRSQVPGNAMEAPMDQITNGPAYLKAMGEVIEGKDLEPARTPGAPRRGALDLQALVNEQAVDVGLWFKARTAPEAYLQQELRRLHAAIEALFPSSEEGYRDLVSGERIQAGDEVWAYGKGPWSPVESISEVYYPKDNGIGAQHHRIRRPIAPQGEAPRFAEPSSPSQAREAPHG